MLYKGSTNKQRAFSIVTIIDSPGFAYAKRGLCPSGHHTQHHFPMKRKIAIAAGIIATAGIAAALIIYFFVYNKPHTDYASAKADFQLDGSTLFEQFRTSPAETSEKYTGKVLDISGILTGVEQVDSLTIALFSFEDGLFGSEGIRFTMLPDYSGEIISTPPGSPVTIKGLCTGYNETDVILEHCSLLH